MPVMLTDPNMGGDGTGGTWGGAGGTFDATPVDYSQFQGAGGTFDPGPAPAPAPTYAPAAYSPPDYLNPATPNTYAQNYAPASYASPAGGGGNTGSYMNTAYQPGNTIGGGGAPAAPAPPRIIHNAQEYIDNGTAYTDPTYVAQKSALVGKLNDLERQDAAKVGDQNLSQVNVPQGDKNYGLLGSYWKMNALPSKLYNETQDNNGNNIYKSTGTLDGGTMGTDFNTAIANFENQQQKGMNDLAESYAARGMLGGAGLGEGSGVWQNARTNLENQYNNQIGNINNSVIGQYNDLLSNLADQYSQGNQTLTGYLGDASNRMATAANAGLPTG